MKLEQTLEAILFAGAKPFSVKKLAELADASKDEVEAALTALAGSCKDRGIMLQRAGSDVQLVTKPDAAELVAKVVRDETLGELTRAALEALTILAYRGPMTRPELEQIRGIQSALILRNLMLRGLVEEKEDKRLGQPLYVVTFEFIRHLGLSSVDELPDYTEMRGHELLNDVLSDLESTAVETKPSQDLNV